MRETQSTDRAVSPVVGVALMIAVTVTLVAVITPVIFSVSGSAGESPPQSNFAFFYDESVTGDQDDAFGQNATEANGDGLVTIVLDTGADIPADQLNITGTDGGGELVATSTYDDDDDVLPGDEITVWAARGDEVQVIWTASDGDSAILDEYTVYPEPASP